MDEFGPREFAAVILTGGTGRRIGGADKAHLVVDGRTMLASALEAVHEAAQIVIVGPPTELPAINPPGPAVSFALEDPPSGGPAAGLIAGRDALPHDVVLLAVLAVDMPGVTADTIRRLLQAIGEGDGAFLHDPSGRRQLAGVLDVRRLDDVRPPPTDVSGMPLHRLLESLKLSEVRGEDSESRDVDTPDDLYR